MKRLIKRVRRKVRALRYERICSKQGDPLAAHPGMVVTTFYDVEGDYAMPGQTAASIETVGRILEIEQRYGIRSTYNVVARYALDSPDLMQEIRNGGHEIASHSYDHTILTGLNAREIRDHLHRTKAAFQELGLDIAGHRSPQSAWDGKVVSALMAEGYTWSAENGAEPHPYRIGEARGAALWRCPVTDDDWCYEAEQLSPKAVLERWQRRIREARGRSKFTAIGFHPWVEASAERLAVLEEFFHWLTEQADVELLPFGDVLRSIEQPQESAAVVSDA